VNGNASAWWVDGASGARRLKFEKCGLFSVDCVFEPGVMKVSFTGGSPAKLTLVSWEFKSEGGNPLCGEEIAIAGKCTVAAPKPVWVAGEP
jgi:hypothetical protein